MKKIIKIEKRFEKNLRERFDEGNAVLKEDYYEIDISCELCDTYILERFVCSRKCPFICFENSLPGCMAFIKEIMKKDMITLTMFMYSDRIIWDIPQDKEARAFLRLLCKEAKKRIRFM